MFPQSTDPTSTQSTRILGRDNSVKSDLRNPGAKQPQMSNQNLPIQDTSESSITIQKQAQQLLELTTIVAHLQKQLILKDEIIERITNQSNN